MPAHRTQFPFDRARFFSIRVVQHSLRFSGTIFRFGGSLKNKVNRRHDGTERTCDNYNTQRRALYLRGTYLECSKDRQRWFSSVSEVRLTHSMVMATSLQLRPPRLQSSSNTLDPPPFASYNSSLASPEPSYKLDKIQKSRSVGPYAQLPT